jgi:aldehyde:ferredoxin oxidoreductase
MRAGERIYNLERMANLREGFTREDDGLPERLLSQPVGRGPAEGRVVRLPAMLREFYRFRGWDDDGVPGSGTLANLGLEFTRHEG